MSVTVKKHPVLIVIVINVLDHSKHQGVVIILSHYNDVSLPIGTSFVGDLANTIYVIILVTGVYY